MQGVDIKQVGKVSGHPEEDKVKMLVLGLLYMMGSALDECKRREANRNQDGADAAAVDFMKRAAKLWPLGYGTLQQTTKYIGEDLGFVLDEVTVGEMGNA